MSILPDLKLSITNRPVDVVMYWRDRDGGLELNPPYQRGDVWGVKRKRNLIRSLLMGVPIPSLIINDRMRADFVGDNPWAYAVIDGKQRITAILDFMDSKFMIPSNWLDLRCVDRVIDGRWVVYSGLSEIGKRRFKNQTIAVSEGRLSTLEQEKEVFDLVNFGGLAQGEVDEDRE